MPVTVRRDIGFTRLVYETADGKVLVSPWVPMTRIDVKNYQLRSVDKHGRPLYRVNCRLKPHQRPK